jgi:hypothetical protein
VGKFLDRRRFLRGAGAAVALPLLDSMVPAHGQAAAPKPRRAVFVYIPNGVNVLTWQITKAGADFEFPEPSHAYPLRPLPRSRRGSLRVRLQHSPDSASDGTAELPSHSLSASPIFLPASSRSKFDGSSRWHGGGGGLGWHGGGTLLLVANSLANP